MPDDPSRPRSPSAKQPWPWEKRRGQPSDDPVSPQVPPAAASGPGPIAAFFLGIAMTIIVLIVAAIAIAIFYGDPGRVTVLHETAIGTWLTAGGVWALLILTAWRR